MHKKFAHLHFVETTEHRLKILNKSPALLRDWYIDKFNPYLMESMNALGEEGYTIRMPLTAADARKDEERTQRLTRRTLQALMDYKVDILLPPKDYPFEFPEEILIADGKGLFPFFIMEAIVKVLKILGKDLKKTEIFILDGDSFLTQTLIYNLYPHVNFLNVMVDDRLEETYRLWADFIFSDTGLNMGVFEKNKRLLETADIVINTCTPGPRADHSYQRGAVFFELGRDRASLLELAGKREDMLLIDGLKLNFPEGEITDMLLQHVEAAFFVKSKAYRALLLRGFQPETADAAARELKKLAPRLSSLCFDGIINHNFTKRRNPS